MLGKFSKPNYWRQISLDEIISMHATSNYSLIFLRSGHKVLLAKCLKELERKLVAVNSCNYLRVSRSDLVNLEYISDLINGTLVLKNNVEIPISRRKRNEVVKRVLEYKSISPNYSPRFSS